MLLLQLIPVILSLVVLAAHFARHGQMIFAMLSVPLMGLLVVVGVLLLDLRLLVYRRRVVG